MKKIIPIVLVILVLVGIIYYNSYTGVRTFDIDGYIFTSDNITNNLINGESVTQKKLDYSKVKSNDTLYMGRGRYFIGEKKKVTANIDYPVVSKDSDTLLILSDNGKLIDSKFRKTTTYANSFVSDSKLFNETDYERADDSTYLFMELGSSIFINLREIKLDTTKNYTIPVNSFITFDESSLRYYYMLDGKYIYKEIKGIDKKSKITINKKRYSYETFLQILGLFSPEDDITDMEIAPEIKDEEIIIEETEEGIDVYEDEKVIDGEVEYVKPTVTFGSQTSSVYSVKGKLEINDPTGQILKYPTFEFKKGNTIVMRKTFVSSDTIEVKGLYPESDYEVVGTFHYKNEKGQEVKSEFTRFNISTKDISSLELVDFEMGRINVSSNSAEFEDLMLKNKEMDEVLKGIKKVTIQVGNNNYQLGQVSVSKMIKLMKQNYTTAKSLTSNTHYTVKAIFVDNAGNELKTTNKEYTFKTSKQTPTGSLAVKSRGISTAKLKFDINNKDNINIENMEYTIYDSQDKLIKDEKTDNVDINVDGLDANEVYSVYLHGDYDLEDGQGILKDQLILDGKFTTEPISTLGYVKLNFDNIKTTTDIIKYDLSLNDETNATLRQLITNIKLNLCDVSNMEVVKSITLEGDDFQKLVNGETLPMTINGLLSNHSYTFDLESNVLLGNKNYTIKTQSNITVIKTIKTDAEVQIVNRFVTKNMINFDVRIADIDTAISTNRVLLEVRNSIGVMVYYEELPINGEFKNISITKLNTEEFYSFKFKVEGYNTGHTNETFETDYVLYQEQILTEDGLSGTLEIDSLLKQITGKNLFDITNTRRWKTGGAKDTGRRKMNTTENTVSLGAKNGYRTYSYYLPEYKNKQVTVSFDAKYADKNNTKPVWICPRGSNNCADYSISNISATEYKSYKYTFTVNASSPYISFTIREDAGQNNVTTLVIKDLQIELGPNKTDYVPYQEKPNYMGKFIASLEDKNKEIATDDFHYYMRYYKNDELVDTVEYDFDGSYRIYNDNITHEIEPASDYNVRLSIRKRITDSTEEFRYYDIANLNFTSDDEIRTIHNYDELMAIHTSGFYLVAGDIDYRDKTGSIGETFNGIIDFQGHKVIRDSSRDGKTSNSANYMFYYLGSNAVLRNMDLHIYFDGSARGEFNSIAYYNYGLIENLMVTFEQGNNQPNTVVSLILRENYGTVKNFVVHCKESLSVQQNGTLGIMSNYGTIMNGYMYGAPIDGTFENTALDNKYIGGIARYCNTNSYVANVYSLVGINLTQVQQSKQYQYEVGNIIGPSNRSVVRNVYSYAEGTNRNLSRDVNIYSGTMNVSNVYYATRTDFSGSYSNKISANSLRMEAFQNILNGDNAFDVENYVKYGYYPHLIWPDVMPNQEYIELPSVDDGNVDFLALEDRIDLEDEKVQATLVFQNPGYDEITSLTFNNGLVTQILSQENRNNKSYVKVIFGSPSTYISKYSLIRIKHKNSAGFALTDITYGDKERIVEIDMYKNIHNMTEFKTITSNTTQNFKMQTDLDFNNIDFNIGTFKGKLDGNGHTFKNIRETNKAFINYLNGGTIKNLFVDTYVNNGNSGYGGFIAQGDASASIDNVHLKNVSITDKDTYVGGLIGYTNGLLITNSSVTDVHIYETNKENVRYYGRYGGMVGQNENTIIQNSYVQGLNMEIDYASSTFGIGGIIGRNGSGHIQDCYAQGSISTKNPEVGGIVGYNNAVIERVISNVDVYSQLETIGGVAGYSTNDSIYSTLVLGKVYSYKHSVDPNRTIGNRAAQNINYAWNEQLINGLTINSANGEIFLTSEELKSATTYDSLIKVGDQFDLSKLSNKDNHNLIPKLKYLASNELLPNQKDIEFFNDNFRVDDIIVDKEVTKATVRITINNPYGYTIDKVDIDGLKILKVNRNSFSEGQTIYEVETQPEMYYDSYLIKKINYTNNYGKSFTYYPSSKIDMMFYKDIGTYEDWQKIKQDEYENYRLVADIDFNGKSNINTRVSFNRFEGTDDGHTIKNITYSQPSGSVGLIETVAANISKVNFDNITINTNTTVGYTGVIRFLNGTMYDVNFKDINVSSSGSYVGSVGFNQSPDIKRVNLENITVRGNTRVGGFIGVSRYFDITHVTGKNLTITGSGERVGGLIGEHDYEVNPTMFNFTVEGATVRGTNYVGGILGLGSCDYATAKNVNVTGGSYVGGIAGHQYFRNMNYGYVKDSTITGSGEAIGGAFGYNYTANYVYIDNCTITGTRVNGTNNVGGITGRGGWGTYYSGIRNSTVINKGNYTGGVRGKLDYAGAGYNYVYNTSVTGVNYVGGIAGSHSSTSNDIYYNISNAKVTATGNYAGGLIGYMDNKNTTSATNRIYIRRNIVAGSNITSAGEYAGSIAPNSNKIPFAGHFYDNFIVASVSSNGGNISQFFIGNDKTENGVANAYTAGLDRVRAYEQSTYNNIKISTNQYPSNVTKFNLTALRSSGTFSAILNSPWNFSQVNTTNQKYPYLPYTWTNTGGPGVQLFDLPTAGNLNPGYTASSGTLNRDQAFPEVKVYASDVDKINIEFSKVNTNISFKINEQEEIPISELTYTYYYDYKEDFTIELSDGINKKKVTFKAEDLKELSSVDGNNYYLIDGEKIISNDNVSLENDIQPRIQYKVAPMANTTNNKTTPVNIYDNKILLSNQNIYDVKTKKVIENSFENLTPVETKPLYTYEYGGNKIDTYYNYSKVNGYKVTKQVYIKNNKLEAVDSTLNSVNNNILVDKYNGQSHLIYLGTDGKLHSLKEDIQFPKRFVNKNIKELKTDLYKDSDIVFVLYENGDYVVFNYRNGNIIDQKNTNSNDLVSYFKSYINNTKVSNNNINEYKNTQELIGKIEKNSISKVLGEEEGKKKSLADDSYETIYNPVTKKYEIYKLPNSIEEDRESIETVLNSESISNKINNNQTLYRYYIGKQENNQRILLSVLIIISSIFVGIGVAVFLLRRNIAKKA